MMILFCLKGGRQAFLQGCSFSVLEVRCVDNSVDLCPNGHLAYGLATLAVVALPGALFALSAFVGHGGGFVLLNWDKTYGCDWILPLKLIFLPFYIVLMIILVVPLTVLT